MALKIGNKLYANLSTRHSGDYTAYVITGETKQSWLVSISRAHFNPRKVNKRTMMEANGYQKGMPMRWHTREGMLEESYRTRNRWKIAKQVEHCDVVQLKAIAEIIGYVDHEEGKKK